MLVALLWTLADAHAWDVYETDDGAPMRFVEQPIPWRFDVSASPGEVPAGAQQPVVRKSFDAWEGVPGATLAFEEHEDGHAVYWRADWPYDEDLLGLTTTWAAADGEILGFEIRLNADYDNWAIDAGHDRMDLQNALTHEVGHAIGLDHNHEDPDVTMYPSASRGETGKRDLADDDEDAIRFLYPDAAFTEAMAPGGCSTAPGLPSLLAFALTPLFFRRRTR